MYVVGIFLTIRRFYQNLDLCCQSYLLFYDVRCMLLWPTSQFHYIKIQPITTVDLSTWLRGINRTNSVIISRNLLLRSIVLG